MRGFSRFLAVLLAFIFITSQSQATIINVPNDYQSIQDAINASSSGDTVLVEPGTYYENIRYFGKNITVTSRFLIDNDPAHIFNTILNGSQPTHPDTASVVRIVDSETSSAVLCGFTITSGTGTTWPDPHGFGNFREGGGVLCEFSSPIIKHNIITDNEAIDATGMVSAGGGGIRAGDGNPQIINNIIRNNRGRYGAGIVLNFAAGIVSNNLIMNNRGGEDFAGSGIWKYKGTVAEVANNTIIGNESTLSGAGVYVWSSEMNLRNNIIRGNIAPAFAQIRLDAGSLVAEYNNVEGGYAGTGNFDAAPDYIGDFYYLNPNSSSVDAGDPAIIYNDIEHPTSPNEAFWPSRGTIHNDVGMYGGPGAFPWEQTAIFSDTGYGWAPLDVIFNAGSRTVIDSVLWEFGDATNSKDMIPMHTYALGGRYDVNFTIFSNEQATQISRPDFISVIADTIKPDTVAGRPNEQVVITVYAINNLPLTSIKIPFTYNGSLPLKIDSFSTVGCRTEYFEVAKFTHYDAFNKRATVLLKNSEIGTQPELADGSGPVAKLYFTILGSALPEQTTPITFTGYTSYQFEYNSSIYNYQPVIYNTVVSLASCCQGNRGNIDNDPSDILDISDLLYFIDWFYAEPAGSAPACLVEADVNGDTINDLSDLLYLVDYFFSETIAPGPVGCP